MSFLKKIFNLLSPVLKPISRWYLSKKRTYTYQGITVHISPGVFHPGLFNSTKVLSTYLSEFKLEGRKVLELGAGSGYISLYCCKKGAHVTASDINKVAIANLHENAMLNNCNLNVVESDLFEMIRPQDFEIIIINPPYYPKAVQSQNDLAWYCGENFEYFHKLFMQLRQANVSKDHQMIMILSEDCDIKRIESIAGANGLFLKKEKEYKTSYEMNYIFHIDQLIQSCLRS